MEKQFKVALNLPRRMRSGLITAFLSFCLEELFLLCICIYSIYRKIVPTNQVCEVLGLKYPEK